MAQRKRIGLIFSYSENWIAGSYYILNLIESLKTLPEPEIPELVMFIGKEEDAEIIHKTQYPYLTFFVLRNGYYAYDYTLFQRLINKISLLLFKKLQFDKRPQSESLYIFPNPLGYYFEKIPNQRKICWIPDFQEHYLAEFFSEKEITSRKKLQKYCVEHNFPIVFSSQDALKDFKKIYPDAKNQTFILNFAVTHPSYQILSIDSLREKYQLPKAYFFSPNQFWAHKNQMIILKAIQLLKSQGKNITVVFSGKMNDYRNPDYTNKLLGFVQENQLEENIKFLGFLDRAEQLKLMSEAIAVIQPSLFEGWSTVVEDAKAMNQFIILSDLSVHREQIQENVIFFNPNDEQDLAQKIQEIVQNIPTITTQHYQAQIHKFAVDFMKIIQDIAS